MHLHRKNIIELSIREIKIQSYFLKLIQDLYCYEMLLGKIFIDIHLIYLFEKLF